MKQLLNKYYKFIQFLIDISELKKIFINMPKINLKTEEEEVIVPTMYII